MAIPSYISIADIQEYWKTNIAPNYFDFDNINNYRTGMFGYINEVMGNTTEDVFNAINISRREFYPITAKNKQSFYKMAAIRKIPLPLTTPASCKAFIIIPQHEIISKSTYSNGVYTCVIDNTIKFMADNIPFMLQYPIVILSKKVGNNYFHTCHYDINNSNSIFTDMNDKYIMNLVINGNGVKYLSMSVSLQQIEATTITQLITKDTSIDIVTLDFPFDGNLSGFDVYYSEDNGNTEIYLSAYLYGSTPLNSAYVYYMMINDSTIRLIFPKNSYYSPKFNSEVRINIYTSLGSSGNFDTFNGDLLAQISSNKYPYNNTMTITGKINGASTGGIDMKTDEEFRQDIIQAYATNNTITTENDLQIFFNDLNSSLQNRILFRKKRDDSLYRIYGAYCLLKDSTNNVVPTNTLDLNMLLADFDIVSNIDENSVLKPGTLFEYEPNVGEDITYSIKKIRDLTIIDDLSAYDDNSRFAFTNPFLISTSLSPNVVAFYLNSIDNIFPIDYSYVNDDTYIQFIGGSLSIQRNSILGANYYKFSINITPSTDIDMSLIATKNDPTQEANIIRASKSGKVISCVYDTDHVVATLKYNDDTTEDIIVSNYITYTDPTFTFNTGYDLKFDVGESFVINDIVATKKDTDLGKLRLMLDIDGTLTNNDTYIPFILENINEDTGICTFSAYISTNDSMSVDSKMLIENGIINNDGTSADNIYIDIDNLKFKVNVFYQNDDVNIAHIYSSYNYFTNHTMTNGYTLMDNVALIQRIDFVRSVLTFVEGEIPGDYSLSFSELPMVKANWVKEPNNFKYLVNTIKTNYDNLTSAYYLLENDYGIELKFFNTYGKSRFYKVGVANTTTILDSVNCSFSFGISLLTLTSPDVFIGKFRTYVKEYIESLNDVSSMGQSIYIMNLIASIKENFPEIAYLEYYGMNSYGYEIQKIEAIGDSELTPAELISFIPEFINIYSYNDGTEIYPKIDVTILT